MLIPRAAAARVNFPAPRRRTPPVTRCWRWSEVEAWFATYEGPTSRQRALGRARRPQTAPWKARHGVRQLDAERAPLRRAVRQLLAS